MPTQHEIQRSAIRNAVYGLRFWEAVRLFENEVDDLDRAGDIWDAIERYWPNCARCHEIVLSLKSDICNIQGKRWLRVAIGSHTRHLLQGVKLENDHTVAEFVDTLCGWKS